MTIISATKTESSYNRAKELKAFDDTKTGVKGLVDLGIQKVPKIFIRQSNEVNHKSNSVLTNFRIPVIDVQHERQKVIEDIKSASENWGFFQIVNHGVPLGILDETIKGVLRFHEQDGELKKKYYNRDRSMRVKFVSNFDLYQSKAAIWRDTLIMDMTTPDPLDPDEIPIACRDIAVEYAKHTMV